MSSRINKISRPSPTDVVPRERLFCLLDTALKRPAVWVSAPGGAGKSSLVSSYLAARDFPCIWYQVDRGDQDVATLFYYLTMALEAAPFSAKQPFPPLPPGSSFDIEIFSRRFFEKFFAALPSPALLVLDDCHEVPDESPFHQALRSALHEIPEGIHVVAISRNAPPPSLIHLRSRSRLSMVGWQELRLTAGETEAIVRQRTAGGVGGEDARRLHERIQGWVAGLVLMLEGGAGSPSPAVPDIQPVQEVFDYFAGELLAGMDQVTRNFLLRTAFFNEVMPLPAERLTGVPDAGLLLSRLHGRNCFTERCHDSGEVYRYHPLFREFLLEQACIHFSGEEIRGIRHDAAVALEEADRHEEALEQFLAAESWNEAARLVIRVAPSCLAQGRARTLLAWLGRLPGELQESYPQLRFWAGSCRLREDPVEAFDDFRCAYQLFQKHDDRFGMCISWAAGADATLYSSSIYHEWIPEMEEYLRSHGGFPSPEIEARVIASMFNAMSFQQPDHPRVRELEGRAYEAFFRPGCLDIHVQLKTGSYLAVFNLWCGEMDRARLIADRLDLMLRSVPVADLTGFTVMTTLALVEFFSASFDSCRERVSQALRLAEESGIRALYLHAMGHGLASALSDGDQETVERLLARMEEQLDSAGALDQAYFLFARAWQARLKGDLEGAFRNLAMTAPLLGNIDNIPSHAVAHIAVTELYSRRRDWAAAAEHLAQARQFGARLGSHAVEFMCLLLEADLQLEQSRDDQGKACLRSALALGRRQGYVNMYWWQPDLMVRLCTRALREGIETEYVRSLIRRRSLLPENPPRDLEEWPWPVKVYTLGRFELHIDGAPFRPGGKVQKKPLEMLQALVALGGQESREGQVADLLWPDAEGDTARKSAKSTLHRLRELLGSEKAVLSLGGRLLLDPSRVWTDAAAFEELLTHAQAKRDGGDDDGWVGLAERALALYRGHFLDHERENPAVASLRRRLQGKCRSTVIGLGNLWRSKGELERAMECYLRGIEVDDLAEELYRSLMACYLSAGLRGEMLTTFRRCREALALQGLSPSRETRELYRSAFL